MIVWFPKLKVDVVKLAAPPLSAMVPKVALPSLNVTLPVGVPDVVEVTVAAKVTACPIIEGFCDEPKDKIVEALLTTWLRGGDVLDPCVKSPL
jgi:hypothetical protein